MRRTRTDRFLTALLADSTAMPPCSCGCERRQSELFQFGDGEGYSLACGLKLTRWFRDQATSVATTGVAL